MDPHEIEDTSDWLGCPTRLETVKHYANMLEDEIRELRIQLRADKENISGLVEMHTAVSLDRDEAMRNLRERSGSLAVLRTSERDLQTICRGKDRIIEDLRRQLNEKGSASS